MHHFDVFFVCIHCPFSLWHRGLRLLEIRSGREGLMWAAGKLGSDDNEDDLELKKLEPDIWVHQTVRKMEVRICGEGLRICMKNIIKKTLRWKQKLDKVKFSQWLRLEKGLRLYGRGIFTTLTTMPFLHHSYTRHFSYFVKLISCTFLALSSLCLHFTICLLHMPANSSPAS